MRRPLVAVLAVALLSTASCQGGHKRDTAGPTASEAAVVARKQVGPRLVDLTIRSPALGQKATVRLLTPVGWRPGSARRWPQLWLLHGCCDSYRSWSRETDIERLASLRRTLVIMPEGGFAGFYSDWYNRGRRGPPRWESFHLTELRGLLERDFGAGPRRAIAGLSMGGFGAMSYASRHPGMFSAAASFSGLVAPLRNIDMIRGIASLGGGDPDALWGSPAKHPDVWAAHDPLSLAPRLRGTRLFVASGNGEPGPLDESGRDDRIEAALHDQNTAFVSRLRRLGLPVTVRLYGSGTHTWPYWQRELRRALPLLLGGEDTAAPERPASGSGRRLPRGS